MQRRQCASVDDGAPGIPGRQTCRSWPRSPPGPELSHKTMFYMVFPADEGGDPAAERPPNEAPPAVAGETVLISRQPVSTRLSDQACGNSIFVPGLVKS